MMMRMMVEAGQRGAKGAGKGKKFTVLVIAKLSAHLCDSLGTSCLRGCQQLGYPGAGMEGGRPRLQQCIQRPQALVSSLHNGAWMSLGTRQLFSIQDSA